MSTPAGNLLSTVILDFDLSQKSLLSSSVDASGSLFFEHFCSVSHSLHASLSLCASHIVLLIHASRLELHAALSVKPPLGHDCYAPRPQCVTTSLSLQASHCKRVTAAVSMHCVTTEVSLHCVNAACHCKCVFAGVSLQTCTAAVSLHCVTASLSLPASLQLCHCSVSLKLCHCSHVTASLSLQLCHCSVWHVNSFMLFIVFSSLSVVRLVVFVKWPAEPGKYETVLCCLPLCGRRMWDPQGTSLT